MKRDNGKKFALKWLKGAATILFLAYVGFGVLLFFKQRDFIYFPSRQDFDDCRQFSDSEKLNINGTRAYYKNVSDKVIVFYHGNAGSACDRAFLKDYFSTLGYSSIFVEYTGYANDKNKPSQKALMKDAENINAFLRTNSYQMLIIAGESLGSLLALYHSSIANEDKLLLISPFCSLESLAKRIYPFYPISWMLADKYDSRKWISDIKELRIIHGDADSIVPAAESQKLFDEIAIEDKKYFEIPGAGHNDIYERPELFVLISDFLRSKE